MKVLMVIAPKNFRDEELFHIKEEIEKKAEVVVASKTTDVCNGMLGGEAKPDIALEEAKTDDYDAIVFVGGTGSSIYFNDETALKLAKEFFSAGKLVCAICIAPVILANAGIITNKKVTAFPSVKDELASKGGVYTGNDVEKDGNIITANGPSSATEFGKTIAEMLN